MAAPEETPSEGAPEWMVSYADMITIMMAFFVVMYAMAGVKDPKKEQPVMASMRKQFGRFASSPSGPAVSRSSKLAGVGDGFQRSPETPKGNADMRLMRPRSADQLTLGAVLVFGEGRELTEEHRQTLTKAAALMAGKPQKIEVRGHSLKSSPGAEQGDSWDLAYRRARSTMEFLTAQGIEPRRIRLSVAGQHEPAHAEADAALIKQNARVEVFMLNEFVAGPPSLAPAAEPRAEAPAHETPNNDHAHRRPHAPRDAYDTDSPAHQHSD